MQVAFSDGIFNLLPGILQILIFLENSEISVGNLLTQMVVIFIMEDTLIEFILSKRSGGMANNGNPMEVMVSI